MEANEIRRMRIEFNVAIKRCTCSQAAMRGECHPARCFPTLVKMLYPKGGLNYKSYSIVEGKRRGEEFDAREARRLKDLGEGQ